MAHPQPGATDEPNSSGQVAGADQSSSPGEPSDADQSAPDRPAPSPAAEGWPTASDDTPTVTATLWAFTFADALRAQEAMLAAMRLVANSHLELEDAAIVSADARGKVRLVQTKDVSPGQAALTGSWWGLLAGLFVPGGPLLPMAVGAAAGGLFAKLRDHGINDDEMRTWGEQLQPEQAALFLLVEDCHQARALHEVSRFEATVLTTTADDDLRDTVADRLAVDPWGIA